MPGAKKKTSARKAVAKKKPAAKRKPTVTTAKKAPAVKRAKAAPARAASAAGKAWTYGVHPSVEMVQKAMISLAEKTGRSLAQWVSFIKQEGPVEEKARREWLKDKHGLGTNYAAWIAERAAGKGAENDSADAYLKAAPRWVDAMFAGPKAHLREVYDGVMEAAHALGIDVKACPCQTIVPLYRHHVFANIKPTTRARVDLGLCFKNTMAPRHARLIDTGGAAKGDRITHRVEISSPADLDTTVKGWLKKAYELDTERKSAAPAKFR